MTCLIQAVPWTAFLQYLQRTFSAMLEGGIPVMQTNMETENKQGKKKAKESGPFHVNQREKKLFWKWKTVLEEMIRHALLLINLHLHGWIVGQNVVFHNASLGYAGPAQMCYSNIQTNLQEEPQESTKIWCSFCLSQPIVPRSLIRGYFMVFDVFIALNDRLLFTWFQNLNHKWTGDYSWT